MSRRDGGGVAMSTAMESRENNGTAQWIRFPVQWTNGIMPSTPWEDQLRPIGVRSDIRMGDPNVPHPRDFGRIQY